MTLDEDVAQKLRAEVRSSGRSFKHVVNESLRRGLTSSQELQPRHPFEVRSRPMALRSGLSYQSVSDLLEEIEGSDHR